MDDDTAVAQESGGNMSKEISAVGNNNKNIICRTSTSPALPVSQAQVSKISLDDKKNDKSKEENKKARSTNGKIIKLERKRKYLEKQQRLRQSEDTLSRRKQWMSSHSHYVTFLPDISALNGPFVSESNPGLSELLRPYTNLKENKSSNDFDYCDDNNMFVAEGTETVRLLIEQSVDAFMNSLEESKESNGTTTTLVSSILVKVCAFFDEPVRLIDDVERAAAKYQQAQRKSKPDSMKPPFHVIIATEDVLSAIAGFHISRGAMASGIIPSPCSLRHLLHRKIATRSPSSPSPLRLLSLDGLTDTANLGSNIRTSAALGIDAIILGPTCCDAWYRKSIRVSMGHIFTMPIVRVADLPQVLQMLRKDFGVDSYAAVVEEEGSVALEKLQNVGNTGGWCCVIGSEGNGISDQVRKVCQEKVRIGMMDGVDSFSVPVATGILLHGLKQREYSIVH